MASPKVDKSDEIGVVDDSFVLLYQLRVQEKLFKILESIFMNGLDIKKLLRFRAISYCLQLPKGLQVTLARILKLLAIGILFLLLKVIRSLDFFFEFWDVI